MIDGKKVIEEEEEEKNITARKMYRYKRGVLIIHPHPHPYPYPRLPHP